MLVQLYSDLAIANETLDLLYNTYGLARYAGQIVPMGAFEFPYQTSLDLKITQELPGFRSCLLYTSDAADE